MNHAEYRQIKLSEHLDICGKKQFSVFLFYKILIDSSFIRKEKEKHFKQENVLTILKNRHTKPGSLP